MSAWPYSTQAWQRLRRQKLAAQPLCAHCLPRIVPAEHVDHIQPIAHGGEPFPSLDGLRSLCAPCHSRKTAADMGHTVRPAIDPDTGRGHGDTRWT